TFTLMATSTTSPLPSSATASCPPRPSSSSSTPTTTPTATAPCSHARWPSQPPGRSITATAPPGRPPAPASSADQPPHRPEPPPARPTPRPGLGRVRNLPLSRWTTARRRRMGKAKKAAAGKNGTSPDFEWVYLTDIRPAPVNDLVYGAIDPNDP